MGVQPLFRFTESNMPDIKAPNYHKIIADGKAITDAPSLRARDMRACGNCQFAQPVQGTSDLVCSQYQFEAEDDFVCDSWVEKPPAASGAIPVTIAAIMPDATDQGAAIADAMQGMMSLSPDDVLVNMGEEIKSLGTANNKMTIGAYGVRYGSAAERDLTGTYFAVETNFGKYAGDGADVMVNHGMPLAPELKSTPAHLLSPALTRKDEIGIFAQTALDLSDAYECMIADLAAAGKLRWSSGTTKRLIRYEQDGKITNWPITEWSLTPIAAEPRLPHVLPLKSLIQQPAPAKRTPEAAQESGSAPAQRTSAADQPTNQLLGESNMPELQEVLEAVKSIGARLGPIESFIDKAKAAPAAPSGVVAPVADTAADEVKSFNAAYSIRFGDEQEAQKAILEGAIGKNYRQVIFEQNRAYAKALRMKPEFLEREDIRALGQQIFPMNVITRMVKAGYSVGEMKSTMMTAQGELGGFAVPPNEQQEISVRLPGFTAVRGGGAKVVTLTKSNGIDIPVYTGGDSRYVGAMRGQWGNESKAPGGINATLGSVLIPADIYTYKVVWTQSAVEDANNLVELVTNDIAMTKAIDEDECFLVGDGVGKPRGILPGGLNGDSLTEVNSGAAAALTAAFSAGKGIKALKRGLASQYRANGAFVGASATFGAVEELKDGTGHFYFDDLSDTMKLLNCPVKESEAMPAIGANTYPLIFGNMAGYTIVEKLGMTIARYQDGSTGPNIVEFHIRARVGGRVEKPWMFAVQKVAA